MINNNVSYKDYVLEKTSRQPENVEWTISYSYNAKNNESPRILLIGDSICRGYQESVREVLGDCINVTFWVGSKCVTDPKYLEELDFFLGSHKYDMIFFNNGAHSSDIELPGIERQIAYEKTVDFILARVPNVPLALVFCTPSRDETLDAMFSRFNDYTRIVAEKKNLQIVDLYTPMNAHDKSVAMGDNFHWKPEFSKEQGKIIAKIALETISPENKNLVQFGTLTGPDGALK